MVESKRNTIIKIVIWQCIAICVTISILYIAIGNITNAFLWGLTDHSICLVLHYYYDRTWIKLTHHEEEEEEEVEETNL